MATLDPLALMFDIIRIVLAFGFVIFLVIMFFSFRVEVREDSMKRFVFELSDSLSNSQLTKEKSIFSATKLNEVASNFEPISACDFGSYIEIESVAGKQCSTDGECGDGRCKSGTCNYEYKFGYKPNTNPFATATEEFPVGISAGDSIVPAKMRLTAHDTLLTRISCITQKAHELRDVFEMKFVKSMIYDSPRPVFARSGTHVCIYSITPSGEVPIDCRAMPPVAFDRFDFPLPSSASEWTIAAYPVKRSASCNEIKPTPNSKPDTSIVYQKGDTAPIEKIILCMEAKR